MKEESIKQEEMTPESLDEAYEISDTKPSEEPTSSAEVFQKAKQHGYLTREEWEAQGRDPSEWKSPEEYVEYGNSYSKLKPVIDSFKKTITDQSKQIEALVNYQSRTAEREREKAKYELLQQLAQAKEIGDVEAVSSLSKQQADLEYQQNQQKEESWVAQRARVDKEFMERNSHWFNDQHPDLQKYAQDIAIEQSTQNPNIQYDELVRRVETRMKYEYPGIVNLTPKPAPVISSSKSNLAKSSATSSTNTNDDRAFNSLDSEHKAIYASMKRVTEKALRTEQNPTYEFTKKMFIEKMKREGEI